MLLTSDPYACGAAISHANDWLVVMPIFVDGRVVGWASMFGHMSDVGGKTPCSMPTDARTIYEEGVVIPPFKLYARGTLNEDALRIILNQVRMPDWNRADLNGLVAACRTAGRRVREMCERFGTATYLSALDALLQRNYDAMKVLLQLVFEEGRTLSFTDYICDDGVGNGPYELKLSLTRTGEKVHLDFTGSQPAGRRAGELLHQREPGPDVLRHLHDHRGRPADPLERRVLPADRRDDPGRLVLEAAAPGVAVRAQPRHRPGVRPVRRAARADQPGAAERGRLLLIAALHVLRALHRPGTGPASGSSCTRSASAASPAARSATARTGTRCGPASSTSRASTWSPTTRCASRSGRRSPTPAGPGCTAAATGSTWPTCSRSRA